MISNDKLSRKQRRSLMNKDEGAVEMVLIHIDTETLEGLKKQFGANWKAEAAAILKKASQNL